MLEVRTTKGNILQLNTVYEELRLFGFLTGQMESIYVGGAFLVSPYSSLATTMKFYSCTEENKYSEIRFYISEDYNDNIENMEEDSIVYNDYAQSITSQMKKPDTVRYDIRGHYICHYFEEKIVGTARFSKDFEGEYTLIRVDGRWKLIQLELQIYPEETYIGVDKNGHHIYEYKFKGYDDIPIQVISDTKDENFFFLPSFDEDDAIEV